MLCITWSPSERSQQVAVGGEYHGPLGRPYDFLGIAVGTTRANGRLSALPAALQTHPDDRKLVHDGDEYVS